MTQIDLDRLRELRAKGTQGEWSKSANWHITCREGTSVYSRSYVGASDDFIIAQIQGPGGPNNNASGDFDLIIAAVNGLVPLCDELAGLRADNARLRERLEAWETYYGCESPHDSHVGDKSALGREQERANRAEKAVAALAASLAAATAESSRRYDALLALYDAFEPPITASPADRDKAMELAQGVLFTTKENADG